MSSNRDAIRSDSISTMMICRSTPASLLLIKSLFLGGEPKRLRNQVNTLLKEIQKLSQGDGG
jgi:hypothetical protein